MDTDLNISSEQYQLLLTIFYIGYVLGQPFVTLIARPFPSRQADMKIFSFPIFPYSGLILVFLPSVRLTLALLHSGLFLVLGGHCSGKSYPHEFMSRF